MEVSVCLLLACFLCPAGKGRMLLSLGTTKGGKKPTGGGSLGMPTRAESPGRAGVWVQVPYVGTGLVF